MATRVGHHEPEKAFIRIPLNGINVFLHEPLYKLAADRKARISVEAIGFWKWKRLTTKGLDPYLL